MTLSTINADQTLPAPVDPSLCPVVAELQVDLCSLFHPAYQDKHLGEQKEQFLVTAHRNVGYGQTTLRAKELADNGLLSLTLTHLNNRRLPDERIDTDEPIKCQVRLVKVVVTDCGRETQYGYKTLTWTQFADRMFDGQTITYGALCSLLYPGIKPLAHDY